jgi:hypothetical protein
MIPFYYLLLCIGEYTVKGTWNNSKQMVQFKYKDVTFFCKNNLGQLQCLPRDTPDKLILTADATMLKLDNQKDRWKGVCIYHKTNGDLLNCPVRALSRCYLHLRKHQADSKTFLSAYFEEGRKQADATNEDVSKAIKCAGLALGYPTKKGIPIARLDTHSLRSGGANALSLVGYSDTQIQKMSRWCGRTFKEYIREELAYFSDGMSTSMKKQFEFVKVAGNAFRKITGKLMERDYNVNISTACTAWTPKLFDMEYGGNQANDAAELLPTSWDTPNLLQNWESQSINSRKLYVNSVHVRGQGPLQLEQEYNINVSTACAV